jgi:acetylornithine/N-succinyldiaminopimelate aminotransferase
VLDTIEADGLLNHAALTGDRLRDGISVIDHPLLAGVRGLGLWLAIELTGPAAADVEAACRRAGYLVNAVQPDAIRLAPPLILAAEQADAFCAALPAILDDARPPSPQEA